MSQNLNKLFKQIQKNSEELAVGAMQAAAGKAFELAKTKTKSCLQNYLKKKPRIYKRIEPSPLFKTILYSQPKLKEKGDKCVISFAVRYDSSKIKGVYRSNSWYHQGGDKWISRYDNSGRFDFDSQNNGIPESGWILNNYLQGIHPGWINGEDRGWTDSESTANTMKQFFEEDLYNEAGKLIYESMQSAIIDFIKTNGGGK